MGEMRWTGGRPGILLRRTLRQGYGRSLRLQNRSEVSEYVLSDPDERGRSRALGSSSSRQLSSTAGGCLRSTVDLDPISKEHRRMGMLRVFEVYIAAGGEVEGLLSEEVLQETMAQIMTDEEAVQVGFQGIAPDPEGRERRWIAVSTRDARFIQSRLDSDPDVVGYRSHDVET